MKEFLSSTVHARFARSLGQRVRTSLLSVAMFVLTALHR